VDILINMKVSVCIATYNGAFFIKEQLDSILTQLQPEDELIISDDSSDDLTIEIIDAYTDPRISLFKNNKFRDPIKNFQNALKHAKGDFIFLSDQDDVWLPNKYSEMLAFLNTYDLVISNSIIVDQELKEINSSFFRYFGSGKGIIKNIIKSSYYGSCMAFKKKILDKALPFPDTKEIGHDLWIGLVAEMVGSVYFYEKPLLLYRRHNDAFTPAEVGVSKRTLLEMIRGRVIMISEVIKFLINNKWKKA